MTTLSWYLGQTGWDQGTKIIDNREKIPKPTPLRMESLGTTRTDNRHQVFQGNGLSEESLVQVYGPLTGSRSGPLISRPRLAVIPFLCLSLTKEKPRSVSHSCQVFTRIDSLRGKPLLKRNDNWGKRTIRSEKAVKFNQTKLILIWCRCVIYQFVFILSFTFHFQRERNGGRGFSRVPRTQREGHICSDKHIREDFFLPYHHTFDKTVHEKIELYSCNSIVNIYWRKNINTIQSIILICHYITWLHWYLLIKVKKKKTPTVVTKSLIGTCI